MLHGILVIMVLAVLAMVAAFYLLYTHHSDVLVENLNYEDTQKHLEFQVAMLEQQIKVLKIKADGACNGVKSYF
jgi:hypothetical protein